MKRHFVVLAGVLCLLLCGCTWMDGSYLSITPHQEQSSGVQAKDRTASNYIQLRDVLKDMIDSGTENAVINVAGYRQDLVDEGIANAVLYAMERYPLGAYAVDEISYEVGTGGGQPAISVNISYIHGRSEIRKIEEVANMSAAQACITDALDNCGDSVVIYVNAYEASDLVQVVEDYAKENPDIVMEMPQVAVGVYPDTGSSRVVEVKFTYETSRESLRQMQQQVRRVFASAQLYINSDAETAQKYAQLYTFLMERFDYQLQTSITPAYSLLTYGVGDCEAFASVYAAMCRQAELDCHMVSGTRDGQSWYWNIIHENGINYHVDLLRCSEKGQFQRLTDEAMERYVWDYSAHPHADEEKPEVTE
ncbi:MAG: transglutaminase domain-containing protein [Oscillospiraceae bacterium]|nr:transglutaminase domain-containing protein [Oscillospiraceae bacterium]